MMIVEVTVIAVVVATASLGSLIQFSALNRQVVPESMPESAFQECTTLKVVQCGLLYTSMAILGALLPNGRIARTDSVVVSAITEEGSTPKLREAAQAEQ